MPPPLKVQNMRAFAQALEEQRMEEAKDLAGKISPNSVLNHTFGEGHYYAIRVTECPCSYKHPALTVAIQAGLETAVGSRANMEAWMSGEDAVVDVAKLLIERGARVNATGTEEQNCESAGCPSVHGKTALCAAIQRGSPKLVKLLLDAHADPNHTHKYDQTWGPDTRNPFGPGVLKPESWLSEPANGSVGPRGGNDPRNANSEEILTMLRAAGATGPPPPPRCAKRSLGMVQDLLADEQRRTSFEESHFAKSDANSDGLLQPDEVRAAVTGICSDVSISLPESDKIDALFANCDKNEDGGLSPAEFSRLVKLVLRAAAQHLEAEVQTATDAHLA